MDYRAEVRFHSSDSYRAHHFMVEKALIRTGLALNASETLFAPGSTP